MDVLLTSPLTRAAAVLVLLALVSLAWLIASRRSGTMRTVDARPGGPAARPSIDLTSLGVTTGAAATFVQFSSAVCSPCRQVARVLTALSAELDGVVHIEVDAAQHPELVREHGILRTPTILLVGSDGEICGRASGAMTADQARSALMELGVHPSRPSTLQERS